MEEGWGEGEGGLALGENPFLLQLALLGLNAGVQTTPTMTTTSSTTTTQTTPPPSTTTATTNTPMTTTAAPTFNPTPDTTTTTPVTTTLTNTIGDVGGGPPTVVPIPTSSSPPAPPPPLSTSSIQVGSSSSPAKSATSTTTSSSFSIPSISSSVTSMISSSAGTAPSSNAPTTSIPTTSSILTIEGNTGNDTGLKLGISVLVISFVVAGLVGILLALRAHHKRHRDNHVNSERIQRFKSKFQFVKLADDLEANNNLFDSAEQTLDNSSLLKSNTSLPDTEGEEEFIFPPPPAEKMSDSEFEQLSKQAAAVSKHGKTDSVERRQIDGRWVWKPHFAKTPSIISSLLMRVDSAKKSPSSKGCDSIASWQPLEDSGNGVPVAVDGLGEIDKSNNKSTPDTNVDVASEE